MPSGSAPARAPRTTGPTAFRAGVVGGALFLLAAGPAATSPALEAQSTEDDAGLPSVVLVDPSLSPVAATTSLRAAATGLHTLEDRYLPVRVGEEDGVGEKTLGIGYRLARLIFVDGALMELHRVVRHEVAGHGGRIRLADGEVLGYEIGLPPPYGTGGGATRFRFEDAAPLDLATVFAGGLESAHIDARLLEEKWVARGRMDVREGLEYLGDLLEVVGYVADAGRGPPEPGHDVENYVVAVNRAVPEGGDGELVTSSALGDAASVEALNPTLYYSLYAVLWRYLVDGRTDAPVPALGIGPLRVMPTVHLRLAPFGREYAAGAVTAWGDRVVGARLRLGDGPWGRFTGLQLEGRRLYAGPRVTLGGRLGAWRQYGIAARSSDPEPGGMAVARGTISLDGLPVDPVVELGAKTEGWVPGEALGAGAIVRAGFSTSF